MPYIRILKNTVCDGKTVKADAVIEASEKDARYLIASGKAEETSKPRPKPKANKSVKTDEIEKR